MELRTPDEIWADISRQLSEIAEAFTKAGEQSQTVADDFAELNKTSKEAEQQCKPFYKGIRSSSKENPCTL